MYGDKNAGACAPSLMMHKLPFLVLDLTLSIIESKGQKISEFLKKLYDEVGQSQEYILPRDWITQAYEDNRGEHHSDLVRQIVSEHPNMNTTEVSEAVISMRNSNVYDFSKFKHPSFSSNNSESAESQSEEEPTTYDLDGFCIRSGEPIPFNLEMPFSASSYGWWKKQDKGKNWPERYCHFSGEDSDGETSFKRPVLHKNWDSAKETHGF